MHGIGLVLLGREGLLRDPGLLGAGVRLADGRARRGRPLLHGTLLGEQDLVLLLATAGRHKTSLRHCADHSVPFTRNSISPALLCDASASAADQKIRPRTFSRISRARLTFQFQSKRPPIFKNTTVYSARAAFWLRLLKSCSPTPVFGEVFLALSVVHGSSSGGPLEPVPLEHGKLIRTPPSLLHIVVVLLFRFFNFSFARPPSSTFFVRPFITRPACLPLFYTRLFKLGSALRPKSFSRALECVYSEGYFFSSSFFGTQRLFSRALPGDSHSKLRVCREADSRPRSPASVSSRTLAHTLNAKILRETREITEISISWNLTCFSTVFFVVGRNAPANDGHDGGDYLDDSHHDAPSAASINFPCSETGDAGQISDALFVITRVERKVPPD